VSQDHCFLWSVGENDPYERGYPLYSFDKGFSWDILESNNCPRPDFTFRAFGIEYPPDMPNINGSALVKNGKAYEYTVNSTDLEGHDVFYFIDWGDNTSTDWIGPYPSGETASINHTFYYSSELGDKRIIKAKAKNVCSDGRRKIHIESDWASLELSMTKNKAVNMSPLYQRFMELLTDRLPRIILSLPWPHL